MKKIVLLKTQALTEKLFETENTVKENDEELTLCAKKKLNKLDSN